jgi:RimJ/RimL family protein N-acetyltransferase
MLDAQLRRRHGLRIARELSLEYPAFFNWLYPKEIDEAAIEAAEVAEQHGFAYSFDVVRLFVALSFILGPHFYEHPEAREILSSPSLPPGARLRRLPARLSADAIAALHRMRPHPAPEPQADVGSFALSEGIVLRRLAEDDARALSSALTDSEVADSAGLTHLRSEADVREWIAALTEDRMTCATAIVDPHNGPIGTVVLRIAAYGAALSYWLARPHWGQGTCGQAVQSVLAHAETALGTEHVVAAIKPTSIRSGALLRRAGSNRATPPDLQELGIEFYHRGPATDVPRLLAALPFWRKS